MPKCLLLVAAFVASYFTVLAPLASGKATLEVQPVTPDPMECVTEPRKASEVLALSGSSLSKIQDNFAADELPVGWEETAPAAEGTLAGITATMQQWAACLNAGDPLRLYSLATDSFVSQQFLTRESIDATGPLEVSERVTLVGVFYPREFPNGGAGAVIVFGYPSSAPSPVEAVLLRFKEVDGAWYVDVVPDTTYVEIEEETLEVEGTPAT